MKILKSIFTSAPRLKPADCGHRIHTGEAVLIDVREPDEWSEGFARSAQLLPMSDLTGSRQHWNPFLARIGNRELLLYCASGTRSAIAAHLLVAEGRRAANTGGIRDWIDAGWPIARARN